MLKHIPIQLKNYFKTMFKYMMIHLIVFWCGFHFNFYNSNYVCYWMKGGKILRLNNHPM
jgi:hypothetical protein